MVMMVSGRKIRVCVEEHLPSSMFWSAPELGEYYGSGFVEWGMAKKQEVKRFTMQDFFESKDGWACDGVFWQDKEGSNVHYRDFPTWSTGAPKGLVDRIITGYSMEKCQRSENQVATTDFAWYPAPSDRGTHIVPLPLGPTKSFITARRADEEEYGEDEQDLGDFDYLFNYVVSLGTSKTRVTWHDDATASAEIKLDFRYSAT